MASSSSASPWVITAGPKDASAPRNNSMIKAPITEHDASCFNNSGNHAGIKRSDDTVIIQITILGGRSVDQKKALYAALAEKLGKDPGIRKEDIFVGLIECAEEDFSLGNGIAQYA